MSMVSFIVFPSIINTANIKLYMYSIVWNPWLLK